MIKRMTLLQRRDGMSVAEFDAHWAGPHADIVRELPRVARYNQNPIRRLLAGGDHAIDGVVELWFDDSAAMQESFAVPAAARLPLDEPNFLSGITILSVREQVVTGGTGAEKLMAVVDLGSEDTGRLESVSALLATDPSVSRVVINHVETVGARTGLRAQPTPPAVVIEVGGNDPAALESRFAAVLAELGAARVSAYAVGERRVV